MSLTDIGEHYGCSRQYVQLIFKELGIKRRSRMLALKSRPRRRKSKYNFSPEDDQFLIENFEKMTDTAMAAKLDKPVKSIIYRRLIVLGKKKVNRRNFSEEENRFILENFDLITATVSSTDPNGKSRATPPRRTGSSRTTIGK